VACISGISNKVGATMKNIHNKIIFEHKKESKRNKLSELIIQLG